MRATRIPLAEIPARGVQGSKHRRQIDKALRDQVSHLAFALPLAIDTEQGGSQYLASVLLHHEACGRAGQAGGGSA